MNHSFIVMVLDEPQPHPPLASNACLNGRPPTYRGLKRGWETRRIGIDETKDTLFIPSGEIGQFDPRNWVIVIFQGRKEKERGSLSFNRNLRIERGWAHSPLRTIGKRIYNLPLGGL